MEGRGRRKKRSQTLELVLEGGGCVTTKDRFYRKVNITEEEDREVAGAETM